MDQKYFNLIQKRANDGVVPANTFDKMFVYNLSRKTLADDLVQSQEDYLDVLRYRYRKQLGIKVDRPHRLLSRKTCDWDRMLLRWNGSIKGFKPEP